MAERATTARQRRSPRRSPAPTTPDPIEIAMEAEASGRAPEGVAHGLLTDQRRLVRWQIASERAGMALKLLTGLAGGLAAVLLLGMVWTASRADGLVIEPFSAPPSLTERGITGEALARGLMDRLSVIAATSRTGEVQKQVSSAVSESVSIQIPETGVSLSQVETWLKTKLGHERHVSGEAIIREDGTLRLIIRSGGDPLPDQFGTPSDLPALLQNAAEALYEREQLYSYFQYLQQEGRFADMVALARRRIALASRADKAIGYTILGNALRETEGELAGRAAYLRSLAIDLEAPGPARNNLSGIEYQLGHAESSYRFALQSRARLSRPRGASRETTEQRIWLAEQSIAAMRGDYQRAVKFNTLFAAADLKVFVSSVAPLTSLASNHGDLHDIRRAWAVLASFEPDNPAQVGSARTAEVQVAMAAEDWPRALAAIETTLAALATRPDKGVTRFLVRARHATVLIHLGRLEEAGVVLDGTPLDCHPCIMARGALAEAKGDRRIADHWFGEAVKMAPSLPQASYIWGRALLARGEVNKALAQFAIANARGPNWADPLSGWGEALLKQGNFKAAVAKFKQADKLAPRWGRNHLMWGEALARTGKAADATAQFAAAARMDLTAAERAELQAVTLKRTN